MLLKCSKASWHCVLNLCAISPACVSGVCSKCCAGGCAVRGYRSIHTASVFFVLSSDKIRTGHFCVKHYRPISRFESK
jgi:hypothetical protein